MLHHRSLLLRTVSSALLRRPGQRPLCLSTAAADASGPPPPPHQRYFSPESHEWIALDGRVGISDYAEQQLGDVVHIELPEVGDSFRAGEEMAVIDSVKATTDVLMPVAGRVASVNEELSCNPGLLNESAEGAGWLVRIELVDHEPGAASVEAHYAQSGLVTKAAYEATLPEVD